MSYWVAFVEFTLLSLNWKIKKWLLPIVVVAVVWFIECLMSYWVEKRRSSLSLWLAWHLELFIELNKFKSMISLRHWWPDLSKRLLSKSSSVINSERGVIYCLFFLLTITDTTNLDPITRVNISSGSMLPLLQLLLLLLLLALVIMIVLIWGAVLEVVQLINFSGVCCVDRL